MGNVINKLMDDVEIELLKVRPKVKKDRIGRKSVYCVSEFEDGTSGKEFWHQIHRKDGWRIHVIQWDRLLKKKKTWD